MNLHDIVFCSVSTNLKLEYHNPQLSDTLLNDKRSITGVEYWVAQPEAPMKQLPRSIYCKPNMYHESTAHQKQQ